MTATGAGSDKLDIYGPNGQQYHLDNAWPLDSTWFYWDMGSQPGWSTSEEDKGTITYEFDFYDAFGNVTSPPYDHTWVKKTAKAEWEFEVEWLTGDIEFNGNASNGLGDPEVNRVSSGTHYERKDTGGGTFTVPITVSASVAATSDTNGGTGIGSIAASTSVLDCGLPLISSGIEPSKQKGGTLNVRASDGSMSVDSVAVYDPIGGMWRGADWLTVNCPFDDPLYTWTASGGTPSTYDNSNVLGIPAPTLSGIPLNMGLCASQDGLPITTSVNAKVASGTYSEATDSANYTINWHAPYEAISPGICPRGKDVIETRFSNIGESVSGSAAFSPAKKLDTEVWAEGALIIAFFSGQEELVGLLEVVCHICHITQAALDYLAPEEPAFSVGDRNDDKSWNAAVRLGNVPTGMEKNPDGYKLCTMSLCRVSHWSDQHWNCDKFDHHGWVAGGPFDQHVRKVDIVIDEPYFTPIPGPSTVYTGSGPGSGGK